MTIHRSRLIAELLRIHLQRHDVPCDVDALRCMSSGTRPLVKFGELWPSTTEDGVRVVNELIATFEEQT